MDAHHIHYRDAARRGGRPLIFSRYAGLGSHRHPIGFSGDTVATWDTLAFQPYFSATAANVGYFWWSHDIGGHFGGERDHELATRWYQFGAFSPVNRLHSSASPFNTREPWRFSRAAERIMTSYLRLRHQLVPYLYTAAWASHTDGVAPLRPMYHPHPHDEEAYEVPNQYMFGPSLLVAPITAPADPRTHHAQVTAWLPAGTWFGVFDGRRYDGGRKLTLHRTLEHIPVLAPAGAILPLAADPAADVADSPEALLVTVFAGADGDYTLVEDDGSAAPGVTGRQETPLAFRWTQPAGGCGNGAGGCKAVFTVAPPTGVGVRTRRTLTLEVVGVAEVGGATLTSAGTSRADALHLVGGSGRGVRVDLGQVDLRGGLEVRLRGVRPRANPVRAAVFEVLDQAEIAYQLKDTVMATVERLDGTALLAALDTMELPGNLQGVLTEITAASP